MTATLTPTETLTRMNNIKSAKAATEREYQFSEARWLMSFNVHPDRIASQLGVKRRSLYDKALKWGARDVADWMLPENKGGHVKGQCSTCGVPTSERSYTSCPRHAYAKRDAA